MDNFTGILEPISEFTHRRGLLVACSLSESSANTTVACLLNPSPAAVTVHAYEKIGLFQPLTGSESVGVSAVRFKPTTAEVDAAVKEMEQGITGVTPLEASQLHSLLKEYAHVISTGAVWCT